MSADGGERDDRRMTEAGDAGGQLARFAAIGKGLQLSGAVFGGLLFFFVGLWLDRWLGTAPLFLLIGLVLMFVAIGYEFYDTVRFFSRRAEAARRAAKAAGASGATVKRKSWDEWDAEDRERDEDDDYVTKPRRQRER